MKENEIRASVNTLFGSFAKFGEAVGPVRDSHRIVCETEAARLLTEMLVNFGRLVDACEVIATCSFEIAEGGQAPDVALEDVRPEGSC